MNRFDQKATTMFVFCGHALGAQCAQHKLVTHTSQAIGLCIALRYVSINWCALFALLSSTVAIFFSMLLFLFCYYYFAQHLLLSTSLLLIHIFRLHGSMCMEIVCRLTIFHSVTFPSYVSCNIIIKKKCRYIYILH